MKIDQQAGTQVLLGEGGDAAGCRGNLLMLGVCEEEDPVCGRDVDLVGHLPRRSDVQVGKDTEVGGGQGRDPAPLHPEPCVAVHLQVGVLRLHLHPQTSRKDVTSHHHRYVSEAS